MKAIVKKKIEFEDSHTCYEEEQNDQEDSAMALSVSNFLGISNLGWTNLQHPHF